MHILSPVGGDFIQTIIVKANTMVDKYYINENDTANKIQNLSTILDGKNLFS